MSRTSPMFMTVPEKRTVTICAPAAVDEPAALLTDVLSGLLSAATAPSAVVVMFPSVVVLAGAFVTSMVPFLVTTILGLGGLQGGIRMSLVQCRSKLLGGEHSGVKQTMSVSCTPSHEIMFGQGVVTVILVPLCGWSENAAVMNFV